MDLYTNSTAKDSLRNAFYVNAKESCEILLASPFYTHDTLINELLDRSCLIRLVVRLCSSTSPDALGNIINKEGVQIRYFTSRLFHSKLYIFGDDIAIIGSANLTEAGTSSNREVAIDISSEDPRFDQLISLFTSYWDQAEVLTLDRLNEFRRIRNKYTGPSIDYQCEGEITKQLGDIKPKEGIQVGEKKPAKDKLYMSSYKRTYQEFLEAYRIVEKVYKRIGKRKLPESQVPLRIEIDQFFSFIRETYTTGESYLNEPLRSQKDSEIFISDKLIDWFNTPWDYLIKHIPKNYSLINEVFTSEESLNKASVEKLYSAIDVCHAFHDRYRFYKGGAETMKKRFIADNDTAQVKKSFSYLIFGEDDFIERMGACIFDPAYYLAHFGRSCMQELYGWVNKENVPICNGRTVKALRYLGFNVKIFT